jgi:hypothetical protein
MAGTDIGIGDWTNTPAGVAYRTSDKAHGNKLMAFACSTNHEEFPLEFIAQLFNLNVENEELTQMTIDNTLSEKGLPSVDEMNTLPNTISDRAYRMFYETYTRIREESSLLYGFKMLQLRQLFS